MENNVPGLLVLEAGDQFASVALAFGKSTIWESTFFLPQVHSTVLASMVQKLILSAGSSMSDVEAVVVGKGPGSYTGLRIATSLAKGICFSLNLPLIAISSFENMALQAFENQPDAESAVVSIDARRDEVYITVMDRTFNHLVPPTALRLGEFNLKPIVQNLNTVFVGSGSEKLLNYYGLERRWKFLTDIFPKASIYPKLAFELFNNKNFVDLASFEPEYLKPVYLTQARL